MENIKLYGLIYELKGIVSCLAELAEHDNDYELTFIEQIEGKVSEIVQTIETKGA
ncbi:hypothetical protein V4V35_25440 [Bacillus infantis]|uniref:hypothetical protein n=1 Tax=Bacillus infantis TaxID=324767 RepID=UPI002FBE807E